MAHCPAPCNGALAQQLMPKKFWLAKTTNAYAYAYTYDISISKHTLPTSALIPVSLGNRGTNKIYITIVEMVSADKVDCDKMTRISKTYTCILKILCNKFKKSKGHVNGDFSLVAEILLSDSK
jgi:hypothetical protein